MYLKVVLVLFFLLFSINYSILLPNQPIISPQRIIELSVVNPPILYDLPVRRPSMNPNCFQT